MNTRTLHIKGFFSASLLTLGCMTSSSYTHAVENNFSQGITLFKSEQFNAAVKKFEAALKNGNNSATLHYNLAVSYYKTKKYAQAQQHFLAASKTNKLAAISYYNLGLIAEQQNDAQKANQWFKRCHAQTHDSALKMLAAKKLGLTTSTQKKTDKKWTGFTSGSIGHNNNVSHINDNLPLTSNQSDNYFDFFGLANYQLNGNHRNGKAIKIGGTFTNYINLSNYDFSSLNAGIHQSRETNGWRSRYGAHLYRDKLNGNSYQQRINLQYRGDHNYAANQRFRAQYDLSLINAIDSSYSYLGGTRHRFKVQNIARINDKRIKASYTLELNDREDLQQGSSFTSYSATRHIFAASLKQAINDNWSGRADLNYRISKYNDAKIISGINQGTRQDNRTRITLKGIYHYRKNIEVEAMLRQTNNSSNFSSSDYSNTISQLSLNMDF